jgi:hypothetical protein
MKMFDAKCWYNTIYTEHIEHAEMYPKQPYGVVHFVSDLI